PDNPFLTQATLRATNPPPNNPPPLPNNPNFVFNNLGDDISWTPFNAGLTGTASFHRMYTFKDPLTGATRVIWGTSEGVFSGVAPADGSAITGIGYAVAPTGSRNGNLQITQFWQGAAQPSSLAADLAGALFYGMARENGFPSSDPLVLQNGNL